MIPPARTDADGTAPPADAGQAEDDITIPSPDVTQTPMMEAPTMPAPQLASLGAGVSVAGGAAAPINSVAGYIDSAVIRTRVRTRYDIAWGGDSDRAEFLYGAYDATRFGLVGGNALAELNLSGPTDVIIEELDFQQLSTYLELAITENLSGFVEIPVQWNDIDGFLPDPNNNNAPTRVEIDDSGLSQINAGARFGLINEPGRYLTAQLRVITSTGDEDFALSNGHTAIMPGLLFQRQMNDWFVVFGEVQDWIGLDGTEINAPGQPLDGEEFYGNVLRYGSGVGVDLFQGCRNCQPTTLTLVSEFVGWTVLDGLKTDIDFNGGVPNVINVVDAGGDTIVNAKLGLRYRQGPHSLYAGYGFPLTSDDWYDDILRLEYEFNVW